MMPSLRRTFSVLAAATLMLVLGTSVAVAQQVGSLHGTVEDESRAQLPGVTVILEGMGAPRVTVTDEQGNYRFLNLDPGTYYIKAALDGFSTVEQPNVIVTLNRATSIHFTLSSAVQDLITVTSESPLLDERRLGVGTVLSQRDLESIPTARDPWAVFNQAPGVLVDRINVGGSESAQQSIFRAPAVDFSQNDWLVDGIQITAEGSGSTPTYFDFEQFESMELATGGPDVTKNSAGVSVNMVTRRGTNEFRGTARFLSAKGDGLGFLGQSHSAFDCADLGPNQTCEDFVPSSINSIDEYGFEAGGAAILDRLWLWGSYGVNEIDKVNTGGGGDVAKLENVSVKVNAQLGSNNSAIASWNNGDKTVAGRGAGTDRAPETTWDQRGPSAFWRFEDTHVFSSSLFLTGSYQKSDAGFQLKPRSGCLDRSCPPFQETLWDSDGVWRQNFLNGFSRQPEDAFKLDGSYFFNSGSVSHELKFGGRIRQLQTLDDFAWPGRNIVHVAGENFGASPGPIDFFWLYRSAQQTPIELEYRSLWVQDTIAAGKWTINAGLRYDLQGGTNQPGTTGPSPMPVVFPEVTLDRPLDAGFEWESITPRIGLTYALGQDRDTLLRASFSQFPQVLSIPYVAYLNPMVPRNLGTYAYFLFVDDNGNNLYEEGEFYSFLFGLGFDLKNPAENFNTVDPDLDPELTSELILGVEHSFLPEFVLGLAYTWRETGDISEERDYVRPVESSRSGFLATAQDYVPDDTTSATLPDGTDTTQPLWALDPALEVTGFQHLTNGSRSREYNGVSLTLNKRLANRWSVRGFLNWGRAKWNVPAAYLANDDPTDTFEDYDGSDTDGELFVTRGGGRGRDVFLQSTWQWNLTGIYQVAPDRPWGFNLSANLYGREGFLIPYRNSITGSDFLFRPVSMARVGRFRNDDVTTVDLRLEKPFAASSNINFSLGLDLFNALNEATPLAHESFLNTGSADNLEEVLAPRVWKLGVRVSWK